MELIDSVIKETDILQTTIHSDIEKLSETYFTLMVDSIEKAKSSALKETSLPINMAFTILEETYKSTIQELKVLLLRDAYRKAYTTTK